MLDMSSSDHQFGGEVREGLDTRLNPTFGGYRFPGLASSSVRPDPEQTFLLSSSRSQLMNRGRDAFGGDKLFARGSFHHLGWHGFHPLSKLLK